jgi:enterobactin synthetase component D / holo-[acyl-carrier protein] synthase
MHDAGAIGARAASVELALRDIARRMLPVGHAVAVERLAAYAAGPLFHIETASCRSAHSRRRRAFRGGRLCARNALAVLGIPPRPIFTGIAGEPIWPAGITGSISHTNEIVAAVVMQKSQIIGVGLDVERDGPLRDDAVTEIVCRPEELDPRHGSLDAVNLRRGKLLFAIKEALYKLYWPLAGAAADFHDFRVSFNEERGVFRAELVNSRLPPAAGTRHFRGRFARAGGSVIALAATGAG